MKKPQVVKQYGNKRPPNWVPFAFKLNMSCWFTGVHVPYGHSASVGYWQVCASKEDGYRLKELFCSLFTAEWSGEEKAEVDDIRERARAWLNDYQQRAAAQGEG